MIKIGDQVITSRSRYGTVISFNGDEVLPQALVRIGTKNHWINIDQLTLASHTVKLKVTYSFDYCGKNITDNMEVILKKDDIIFENDIYYLKNICVNRIEQQLSIKVEILKIQIS